MFRRCGLLCAGLALAMLLATTALAGGPIRARLTHALPSGKSAGDRVLVRWVFHDSSGHAVLLKHVVLTIICPTRDSMTRTAAVLGADGTYRANAVVPPGGIGTLSIRTSTRTFVIANPFRR